MNTKQTFLLGALLLALPTPFQAQTYRLDWSVIGDGGGTGTGGSLSVGDTVGQPSAGTGIGGNLTLSSGFWSLFGLTPTETYYLNVAVTPSEAGTVTVDPDNGTSGNNQYTYVPGVTATLTANVNPGWLFAGWFIDASGLDNPITVTMTGNKSVTASFQPSLIVANLDDSGPGSLRQAIADAPSTSSHIITFDPGLAGAIPLHSQLDISQSMTIRGPGSNRLALDGNGTNRILVLTGGNVSISDLTLTNGLGGISNNATLTVSNCVVVGNSGQGMLNQVNGVMALNNSTVCSNVFAGLQGGGIRNNGTLGITNCTISGNRCTGSSAFGGGIYNNNGALTVIGSTICSNSLANLGAPRGGGLANSGGTVTLGNSVIAGNTSAISPDVNGPITSLGYNLIGITNTSGWMATDLTGSSSTPLDPKLGPLQNNGGTTVMHALLNGSPAIDAGKSFGAPTDQRGQARPFDDPMIPNAPGGDGSDIGSYEAFRIIPPSLSILLTTTNSVLISWPSPSTGFILQQNGSLTNSAGWSNFGGVVNDNGTTKSTAISPSVGAMFFRLSK